MRVANLLTSILCVTALTACGASSNSDNKDAGSGDGSGLNVSENCPKLSETIQWQLFQEINSSKDIPTKLSDYNFFKDCQNPTQNPNEQGMPYDLTTALFTDYTTKYRFIFIPKGKTANFNEKEVLDFPVGSVLVKTFSLPKDTAQRGFIKGSDDEKLIETRLLVHTANKGWLAFAYAWNDGQTEAIYTPQGKTISAQVIHKGKQLDFKYGVPDVATCKQCHQLTNIENGKEISNFAPIGPKARLLNRDNEIDGNLVNQITYMLDNDLLSGAPSDLTSIDTVPSFNDTTDIESKTSAELEKLAKGYLDINCAHCHRRTGVGGTYNMDGKAGYSGLKLEYWRSFTSDQAAHGVCKTPIAYSADGFAFDTVPGNADKSILTHRMELQTAKRMPEAGRDLNHDEGVALVRAWVNSLPANNCGQ